MWFSIQWSAITLPDSILAPLTNEVSLTDGTYNERGGAFRLSWRIVLSTKVFDNLFAIILLICFTLQSFATISQAEVKSFNENWSEDITVNGGRTLLVEELSATWCKSCAEIDPYLQQILMLTVREFP